jgi:uncharacterized membrane protein
MKTTLTFVTGAVLLILVAAAPLWAQAEPALFAPADEKPTERNLVHVSEVPLKVVRDTDKQRSSIQEIILDNGVREFGLNRDEELNKATNVTSETVGWDRPDQGNWYHSDMFHLKINGQGVDFGKATFTILESGARGVADFTLNNQYGKFRCRFMVIPNSEVLYADFSIEPVGPVKSVALELINYPGSYQATRGGERHRQVFDAEGTLEPQKAPYATDPAADWWYFYQDAIFDKDNPEYREKTYGPSALVLPQGEAQQVSTTVGAYAVPIELTYAPDRRHFRVAFLKYFGMGNKEALARFAKERDQIRATLEGLVFVPARLREAQGTLPQISAEGLPADVAAGVPELKQLLGALPAGDPWTQQPISSEDRALQLLDQYDKTRWRVVKQQRPGIGVLVMRGLHWRFWGLDDAYQALGKDLRESGVSDYAEYYWKGEELSYFPATWEEMSRYDVIVFANVPFTVLGPERSAALAEYLQNGGAVLLLAGTHGYGQGGIDQPPLGPLMPVQPTKLFDLTPFDKYQALTPTPDAPPWLVDLNWKPAPTALWYQPVQVAPSGKVWMQVGGKPFLITGTAGAGRVAAVCAPPYGVVGATDNPFWQWKSWPSVMAKLLLWLGRGETPTLPAG